MADIEVEMGGVRGDTLAYVDATTEIFEEGTTETTAQDDQLPALMQQELDAVPGETLKFRPITIFRVPAWFHEADNFYYEPKLVSIGPYHHGKEKFRAMEEYKWSTLRDFLARNNEVNLETYLREVKALEKRARLCYNESVSMSSDKIVMMLTLDGCFIIEYFLKLEHRQSDAILFGASWASIGVPADMHLLENQIPFFIIHKLFAIHSGCYQGCNGYCPLLKLIYGPLTGFMYRQQIVPPQEPCYRIQHLLHLCHTCMVPKLQLEESNPAHNQSHHLAFGNFSRLKSFFLSQLTGRAKQRADEEDSTEKKGESDEGESSKGDEKNGQRLTIIPCVSELHGAGVKFRRKRKPRHMLDISFENGIIEMPHMEIDAYKKIIFTNVAAFEQSQWKELSQNFSSYLGLMDALVSTKKDVALLQEYGILENLLQNEKDASMFYNHFGGFNLLNYNDHYFRDLFIEVHKYSESTWHKYRAKLMNDYFNNPWTIISVVAGGVLLILTVVQTFYTIYSSYHS
ncbi:hypothetical protein LUZ60_013793 [Juncus effusus]|nr:hypothetical protein LUZ60_013793 [Juncus effusus]